LNNMTIYVTHVCNEWTLNLWEIDLSQRKTQNSRLNEETKTVITDDCIAWHGFRGLGRTADIELQLTLTRANRKISI
jgi:hypothetical protein